ncbi:MAG: xylulokinase [Vallitaleaceae bacterium]|nr:xylulokinase [Vallitaleaceae bacterium]
MYYLGIDLGTSSVKILATDSNNQIVAEVTKEYPVYFPQDKWAQQDPTDWWTQTKAAIRELIESGKIQGDKVSAISFSGQMHGLVALNEKNEVLTPAILWCDQRTEVECDEITEFFGSEKLSQLTGNKALTGFTAPKILWVKKNLPEIFSQIRHIMLPKDYISFCLTGEYSTDVSDASGMLLLDVKNRKWSGEMLDFIGISEAMLPKLFESFEAVGTVCPEVALELGLTDKVIVAAGAGDQAAGAVGTGTVSEGIVSVTLGTSGVVFAAHEQYAVDQENRLHAFCHANGKYHSMGVMLSAANCLKWWVESVVKDQEFNALLAEAQESEMDEKVLFLPYLMGERTPYSDPDAKGAFVGMTMNSERGSLTRAVLEGVSFGLRDSLEILKDIQVPIREIRVIGGGAKSPLWKQILADIFKAPIQEINTNQGGALGAAILAATAAGHFASVEEGCSKMIRIVSTVEPIEANCEAYDRKYKKYQALYPALQAWYKL